MLYEVITAAHGAEAVESVILTASGGPFRNRPAESLATVTPEDALKHPTWSMGSKITIDSATLANKGLEVIEACRLFDLKAEAVRVVVHPESLVHSVITSYSIHYTKLYDHVHLYGKLKFCQSIAR